jgi:hypothetical protein
MEHRRIRIRKPAVLEVEAQETVTVDLHKVTTFDEKTFKKIRLLKNPAYVDIKAGVTRKLDDFEFLRLDVGVSVPCDIADIDATQQEYSKKVCDMLANELNLYIPNSGQK